MPPRVFMVWATSLLGKAIALDLRRIGWEVNTTARGPSSDAAKELTSAGVHISPGDYENDDIIADGMMGCDGLFLNLCLGRRRLRDRG